LQGVDLYAPASGVLETTVLTGCHLVIVSTYGFDFH